MNARCERVLSSARYKWTFVRFLFPPLAAAGEHELVGSPAGNWIPLKTARCSARVRCQSGGDFACARFAPPRSAPQLRRTAPRGPQIFMLRRTVFYAGLIEGCLR